MRCSLSKLVEAFIGAMKDVVWVAMLVVIIVYIFAVLTCQFYGNDQKVLTMRKHFTGA